MLKLEIAKLEEVAEALRDFYKEKDGKFYLQVDGMKTQADIDKQLAANQKERTEHAATKATLKVATDKLAVLGELDPDEIIDKLAKLETLEAAGANPKAEEIQKLVDAGVTAKLKVETQRLERTLKTTTDERDALKSQVGELGGKIVQRTVDDAVRDAATVAKVVPEAIGDVLILARSAFKLTDGKVVDESGRDPSQWLEDSKKSRPYLWPRAQGAGGQGGGDGGGLSKDNPFSADGWNLTEQGKLVTANPTKAAELAALAGTTVGAPRPQAVAKK